MIRFMSGRVLGVVPLAWLSLLVHSTLWYEQDEANVAFHLPGLHQSSDAALCTVLYIFLVQVWWLPICSWHGPMFMQYASILFTTFCVYSLVRAVLSVVQDRLMMWRDPKLVLPFSSVDNSELVRDIPSSSFFTTWKQRVGNTFTLLSYNRANNVWCILLPLALAFMVCILLSPVFVFLAYLSQTSIIFWESFYNIIEFLPYFLLGSAIASFIEVLHYWECLYNSHCSHYSFFRIVHDYGHRFIDFLFFMFVFFLTNLFGFNRQPLSNILRFVILPLVATLIIILSYFRTSNKQVKQSSILRSISESEAINLIGYCSYPVYLFQRWTFEYMVPKLLRYYDPNSSFNAQHTPWYNRVCIALVLIWVSWLVQRYFQDTFVVFAYERFKLHYKRSFCSLTTVWIRFCRPLAFCLPSSWFTPISSSGDNIPLLQRLSNNDE